MINISNNGFIYMNRGDSFKVPLVINQGTKEDIVRFYISHHPSAEVYFGLMEPNQRFEDALLKKHLDKKDLNFQGDLMLGFRPEDTEYLLPAKYYYALKAEIRLYNHQILYRETEQSTAIQTDLQNYELIYGWEDEAVKYTFNAFQVYLNTLNEFQLIGRSVIDNNAIPLYAKISENKEQLLIYGLKEKDNYSVFMGSINISDLWKKLTTQLCRVVVDTIVPPTDFLIMD